MLRLFDDAHFPAVLLWAFVLVIAVAQGAYSATHLEPSGQFALIWRAGLLVAAWNWLEIDSRKRRIHWTWDIGLFLVVAGPFILPYHLWKTRGVKTLLILLVLLCVWVGGFMVGFLPLNVVLHRG